LIDIIVKCEALDKKMTTLKQSTLSERVFHNLKEEIVSGNIPQGQKISEVNLATRFNISRGPLREALRQLESINLIERTPHSGSKVISLTYRKILELYQIREAMEGYATRLASSEMTQSEIDGLYRLLDQHNEQVQSSGEHVYIQQEGNLDFHYYIYSKCNNQWLFDYLDNKLYQLLRMCRQHTAKISSRADLGLIEHTAIVNAISNRDGELSELLMRRHINGAWKTIKDIVIEEDLKKDKSI
jgi:DNA-binding GntR family transcriptional regulator